MQGKQTSNLEAEGNSQPKENGIQHKMYSTKDSEATPNP